MYLDPRLLALTRGVRLRILAAAVVGILAVGAGVARLAVAGAVIVRVIQDGAAFSSLLWPLVAMAGLILLRSVLQYLQGVISHHTASIVKIRLRGRLYEHALALGPGHFDQGRTGDVLLSLADGVERLEAFFGRYLPQLFVAAVAPGLIFAFMAVLDIRTGLIFLGFAFITLVAPTVFHRSNRRRNLDRRAAYGALGADFLDSVQGLSTLKAFGQSRRRGELLADRARHLYRTTMRVLAADVSTSAITILGASAGASVALGWGATRVSDGELELRTLLIVLMLGVEVFRPLRELVQLYHEGMIAMSSAEGIFAILDTPVEVVDPSHTGSGEGGRNGPSQHIPLRPEIVFENVSFAYNQGRRPALHDVSFTLRGGETLGLVGPSGAGKSTAVWLMLRFVDPQQGKVLLGGHDLRELPLETLRAQTAVVTQDTYMFYGSVEENLRLGKPEASQAEMEAAARAANAHDFITELPQGYDTIVGERAARLSGGQKQRIAIARALLKDAPILILDEALSSVDAENEAVIQEALNRLMKGRTTLIIAHRLSSVVGADRILVLDEGHLVESGSHHQLVSAGGVYAGLMANQQSHDGYDVQAEGHILAGPSHEATHGSAAEDGAAPLHDHSHGEREVAPPEAASGALPIPTVWARLLQLVRPWWGQLVLTFLLGISQHGSIVGVGAISALLVGQVVTGGDLSILLILLGVFVPLAATFTWLESWMAHDLAFRLLAEIRVGLYRRLDPLAPAYMMKRRSGDIVSIAGGDIETIEYFFGHTITPAFVAIIVPAGVLATLAVIAWPIALVIAPFLLATAVSPFFAQKRSERLGEEVRSQLGEVHSHMVDSIQGLREVSAFGNGRARASEMVKNGWRFARYQHRFLKEREFQLGFIEAMTTLGGLSVLTMGVWLLTRGNITRPELILAAVLSISAFAPISDIARTVKQLMETLAASRRVFAVHDEPVPVRDGPGVVAVTDNGRSAPSVSFEGVGFSYGPGEPQALREVSFNAEPGQTVALVGRSGAGKTTCTNLLMRFWDPDSGRILLEGHDIRDFDLEGLRRHMALVSQDTYLFNASVMDNLRLGNQHATDAEIEEAARQANAHDFIAAFPDGYGTVVGERGMQLSGGQRQRIAIARALIKNAPVLILDEATSHLDAVNEQLMREALERLMHGRTTLVIAHRLSTVRDAHHIVVLDAGRVVENGNHHELLETHGLYAQLVSTQLVAAGSGPSHHTDGAPHPGHSGELWPGMPRPGHHH